MNELLIAQTIKALIEATATACIQAHDLYAAGTPEPQPQTQRHLANLFRPILAGIVNRPATDRPRIVCLCGSVHFKTTFAAVAFAESLLGKIVLSVHNFTPRHELTPPAKSQQDALHRHRINLADEVLVLNHRGYIGSYTRDQINYAVETGTPVRFLEPPPKVPDPGAAA